MGSLKADNCCRAPFRRPVKKTIKESNLSPFSYFVRAENSSILFNMWFGKKFTFKAKGLIICSYYQSKLDL